MAEGTRVTQLCQRRNHPRLLSTLTPSPHPTPPCMQHTPVLPVLHKPIYTSGVHFQKQKTHRMIYFRMCIRDVDPRILCSNHFIQRQSPVQSRTTVCALLLNPGLVLIKPSYQISPLTFRTAKFCLTCSCQRKRKATL